MYPLKWKESKPVIHRYLIAALMSAPTFAGSFSFTAITTGQPVYNRPLLNVGVVTTTFASLSPNAPAVPYSARNLSIVGAGTYTFTSTGTSPLNWDNALFLYSVSFDPLNPLSNILIGMTGYQQVNQGTSAFNITLATGSYFLVTTGVFNADFGTAANSITGPGAITSPTPEPGPIAMIGFGLVLLGTMRFRRRETT